MLDTKIPYFDQYPYTNLTLDVMMSADNVMYKPFDYQ